MLVCDAETHSNFDLIEICLANMSHFPSQQDQLFPIIFSFDSVFSSNKLQTEWNSFIKSKTKHFPLHLQHWTTMMILWSEEPRAFLAIRIPDFAEKRTSGTGVTVVASPALNGTHFPHFCRRSSFLAPPYNSTWHASWKSIHRYNERVAAHKSRKIRKRN